MTIRQRQTLWAYTFLLLPLLFFLIVRFLPTLSAFRLSLYKYSILNETKPFLGLGNYSRLLGNPVFHKALINIGLYTLIGVPAQIVLGLLTALLLAQVKVFQGLLRSLYLLPYITPVVAAAWIWQWVFSLQFGPVNTVLVLLHLPAQNFLTSPAQALPTTAALVVWQNLGFQIVLFLAGLAAVPRSLYEAADLDGASAWQAFWGVTFPLLNPTIVFSVVTGTISFLQLFTQVINLNFTDQGGPLGSTLSVAVYIYQMAFGRFEMGYAAAMTVALFVIIMFITVFQLRFLTRKFEY